MPRVDFVISNDRHHAWMFKPVVQRLAATPGYHCRILSLTEFRGIQSPVEDFRIDGVDFVSVVHSRVRSSRKSGAQLEAKTSWPLRRVLRDAAWHSVIKRSWRAYLKTEPDVVLLPNDAAFPYDRIVEDLKMRKVPFLLVQEGIRFSLPLFEKVPYGGNGAAAIAAWGETSFEYFSSHGAPPATIHLTGSPRFDVIPTTNWSNAAVALKSQFGLGTKNLLFLSNPIDDQGFCTTAEKLELVRRFMKEIAPLFDDPNLHLIIKLHSRESVASFAAQTIGLAYSDRIHILNDAPLYPLFILSQAAVIMSSTAGLEAMLFGLPLGVLELPGTGFVFDYVSSGAAQGLTWRKPLAPQLAELLNVKPEKKVVSDAYLDRNLVTRTNATEKVFDLTRSIAEAA